MTREQAISLLTQVKEIILGSKSWLDSTHQPIEEAFNMAIEALANVSNTLNALDTISRQAAIEAINQICPIDTEYDCTLLDRVDVRCVLADLPSAQPEIIRCQECKHWDKTWTNDWSPDYHYCSMIEGVRKGDFCCADAERRTE